MILYKFRSLADFAQILDILLNERLYCARYSDLNDPFEGQFVSRGNVTEEAVFTAMTKLNPGTAIMLPASWQAQMHGYSFTARICSLSKKMDDVRMWSHYGDSHRGVAVEIDFTSCSLKPIEVEYSKTLQVLDLEAKTEAEMLTVKTDHWTYETEYRIVQEDEYYPIAGCVRAIYCGTRVTDSTVELLKKATANRWPILRTQLDKDGVRIVPTPLPGITQK